MQTLLVMAGQRIKGYSGVSPTRAWRAPLRVLGVVESHEEKASSATAYEAVESHEEKASTATAYEARNGGNPTDEARLSAHGLVHVFRCLRCSGTTVGAQVTVVALAELQGDGGSASCAKHRARMLTNLLVETAPGVWAAGYH